MTVCAFDRSVLMRDAAVVARRRHLIVAHQRLIALRQIFLGVAVQVAERRRQTVATMLFRYATKRPKGILQALGQRDETFSAEND